MKISNVRVDGFGVWTDLTLQSLSHEVTVFFGPNEAGKTTLMQLVRAVLYGYSPERRQRYLPPVFGGKPGGRLTVEGSRGAIEIDRRADRSDRSGLGKVTLQGADGASHGQHLLTMMLAGVDETIFSNVFAVGLREIQELGTLTGTQAASHLFALTAGMDRVSLVDVMRDLIVARNEIITHDGAGHLSDLIARREKLTGQIEQQRAATSEWSELVGQQLALDRQTTEVEAEVSELEHRLRVLELADRIRERWLEHGALSTEIEELEPLPELPAGSLEQFDELAQQIAAQQTQCDQLKAQYTALREEARGLPINEGIRRNCCRIEALGEQEPWLTSIRQHIDWLQTEIATLETELVTEREELSLPGAIDWDDLPKLRDRAEEELQEPGRQVKAAQETVEKTRGEVAARRAAAKQVTEQFDSSLAALGEEDLSAALEVAGDRVNKLRRRLQLDERMQGLRRHRKELEEESDDLAEDQVLSFQSLVMIGLLFAAGVAGILTGFMYTWFGLTVTGGWIVGAAGGAAILGSLIVKATMERIAASRMDDCDEELDRVLRQMKKAKREMEQLDDELPEGGGPLAARVHEAERQLSLLEELVPLDADRAEAKEHDEAAQQRARDAAAALKEARNTWRESLVAVGLPGEMTAEQIQRIVARCDYLVDLHERLRQRRDELEKRNAELISLTARINRISDDVGVKLPTREPQQLLAAVVEEHASQQDLLKQRDALRQQGKAIYSEYRQHAKELKKLQRAQREVLRSANVSSEDVLRELAATIERYNELIARRDQLDSEITAIIGDIALDEIEAELPNADKSILQQRSDALASQLGQAEVRKKELYQQAGRVGEQIKVLEADTRLPEAELELACLNEQIAEAVARWRLLAGASVVLESVRHIYETERQPATLSDASKYLDQMTDGRYTRVWTPLDEDTLLVDDAHGNSLGIEYLSAGTREQVFLAIRLALVAMYARRGAELPLVLDDVLVNCDAVRTKAAAKVLCEFAAEGHQLLIFTCHEHIMRIFQMLHADVRKLPVRSELGPAELKDLEEAQAPPVIAAEPEAEIEEESLDGLLEELIQETDEEADTEIFADIEPEDEEEEVIDLEVQEPEPMEVEPVEFAAPVIAGDDEWVEDQPPGAVDDEPFAALLQLATDRRSHWTPFDERAWEEVD